MELQQIDYQAGAKAYRGFIAAPADGGPHPAILVAHEAPGLSEHTRRRALRLASEGYVAFAIDYVGKGRVMTTMSEVAGQVGRWVSDPADVRIACGAAHQVLLRRPDVDPTRVAGFGYCFGAQALVEYARTGADLLAVVGFHPGMSVNRPAESPAIRSLLLMLAGSADPITTAAQRLAFEEEMDAAGVDWRMVTFGGAPHSFTNEDAAQAEVPGVAYDEKADRDSWSMALRFLAECGMAGSHVNGPAHPA